MQQSDPPRDVAAERGVRPAVPTRADVDALMKRCQIGVGGRRALDDAHSIMADCYGTLGALMLEVESLRTFARDVMTAWPHGDLEGCDLQTAAVARGLLTPETRTQPCGEDGACNCAEYYSTDEWQEGITCYRRVSWLRA